MSVKSANKLWHLQVVALMLTLSLSSCGDSSSSDDPASPGVTTYTVGGFVSNLTGTGMMLRNNGGDDLPVMSNGKFTFDTPIADGADYEVLVLIHPTDQKCDVTLGGGTIMSQNVINVTVQCKPLSTPHVAFITSSFGNGNLSTWADAGGLTGLAAGDAICQTHATRAGLTGTFVTWLSDSNDDAYCRAHNLTGKKSANCGQVTLPTNAGPWLRTDGYPFAPTIDLFTQYVMYTPIKFDESGAIPAQQYFYMSTDGAGELDTSYSDCSGWTVNNLTVGLGSPYGTGAGWHYGSISLCSLLHHLACFQTGTGSPLPTFAIPGKKVFITSTPTTGNLGGLAGADATCQAEANAQMLGGTYKAWLSTSTVNAIDRLISDGPWVRVDGVKVADNKTDLTDGEIFTTISVDAAGNYLSGDAVWTGTDSTGIKMADTCGDWSLGGFLNFGHQGAYFSVTNVWTDHQFIQCSNMRRFYCFED